MSDPVFRLAVLSVLLLVVAVAGRALSRYFNASEFPKRFDLGDAGIKAAGPAVVEFTAPWCLECKEALPALEAASKQHDATLAVIDAKDNPGVAAKYKIRTTPTILVIDGRGVVTSAWNSTPAPGELASALQAVCVMGSSPQLMIWPQRSSRSSRTTTAEPSLSDGPTTADR